MKLFFTFLLIAQALSCFSQFEDSRVSLIEDVQAKRTLIYLQNNTDESLNVFLKIDGIGYRRSSDRPLIVDIPANEKKYVKTLIPISGEPSSYDYILVVNEKDESIEAGKLESNPELHEFEELLNHPLVIFTNNDCTRCSNLVELLTKNQVSHKLINVDEYKRYHDALEILLKENDDNTRSVKLPVIRKQGELIYPIWNTSKMAKSLAEEFKDQ